MNYGYKVIKTSCNTVLLYCLNTLKCAVIDPGANSDKIIDEISKLSLKPQFILLTHGHYDHIGAVDEIRQKYEILCYSNKFSEEYLLSPEYNHSYQRLGISLIVKSDKFFEDNSIFELGNLKIKIIYTPGHIKDCTSFFIEDSEQPLLLSGDTLFKETIGRTDLYGSSYEQIINSIKEKLLVLPENTLVIPGHGHMTTIEHEKQFF